MGDTHVIHITRPDQPEDTKAIQEISGKWDLLIDFFVCWTRCDPGILKNIVLVVSHGDICYSIVVNDAVVSVTEVSDLFSDHEETDIQPRIHAHQAAQVFSSVTIKSPDTDAMVLSLAKSQDLHGCLMFFMAGSGSNNRTINITELGIKQG